MLALIPLRSGSKRIKLKNIKEMLGRPLAHWVTEEAVKSGVFDEIVISTDSDVIAYVMEYVDGVTIDMRDPVLAQDDTTTEDVMLDIASKYVFDSICTIQATSPVTTAEDFIRAKELYDVKKCDSLLTAVPVKRFFWQDKKPINYEPKNRPMSQNMKPIWMESGNFYMTERDILEEHKSRLGGYIGIYEMSEDNRYEIDTPEDWLLVEEILRRRENEMSNL